MQGAKEEDTRRAMGCVNGAGLYRFHFIAFLIMAAPSTV